VIGESSIEFSAVLGFVCCRMSEGMKETRKEKGAFGRSLVHFSFPISEYSMHRACLLANRRRCLLGGKLRQLGHLSSSYAYEQ
jgi:hypothetical protein